MKILVTGGLGFIGKHLIKKLRELNHEVYFCDLAHNFDPSYIRCNISSFKQLNDLFNLYGNFDLVYHLAAEFGRKNGEDYYDTLWQTNVIGTKNIIRFQEKLGFKMIFASSSEVYGDHSAVLDEGLLDRVPTKQLNDYAISKWVNELQIINSFKRFGTQTTRVRFFNVYGPGEYYSSYRSAISRFIYLALNDKMITVHRNQTRCSLYISDCIDTLINIIDRFFIHDKVYNLAGSEDHSMEKIACYVLKCLEKVPHSNFQIVEKNDLTSVDKKNPVTGAAMIDLEHDPKVNLEEGIKKTIEWMRKEYNL